LPTAAWLEPALAVRVLSPGKLAVSVWVPVPAADGV
jgi:hypothetical protein